jgi:hypothetical protein
MANEVSGNCGFHFFKRIASMKRGALSGRQWLEAGQALGVAERDLETVITGLT